MPDRRPSRSCLTLAIIGSAATAIAAVLLVIDGWPDHSTVDSARANQSITIEEIATRNAGSAAAERAFDEHRLNVTGVVTAKGHDAGGVPLLVLRLPRDRTAKVTLGATSPTFRRLRQGQRVSVNCESVRVLGREHPYIGLRGCNIL